MSNLKILFWWILFLETLHSFKTGIQLSFRLGGSLGVHLSQSPCPDAGMSTLTDVCLNLLLWKRFAGKVPWLGAALALCPGSFSWAPTSTFPAEIGACSWLCLPMGAEEGLILLFFIMTLIWLESCVLVTAFYFVLFFKEEIQFFQQFLMCSLIILLVFLWTFPVNPCCLYNTVKRFGHKL